MPSGLAPVIAGCRWGSTRSMPRSTMPPARKPIVAGTHEPLDSSIAGASSDQKLAATITPAASPSMPSSALRLKLRVKNTGTAPSAVMNQVNNVAMNACRTGCSVAIASIM